MKTFLRTGMILALLASGAFAADDVVSAVSGTVKTVDKATKTAVVKTGDGTEHTFHFVGKTVSHGAQATAGGTNPYFSHWIPESRKVGRKADSRSDFVI
jgi:hypothetical protein